MAPGTNGALSAPVSVDAERVARAADLVYVVAESGAAPVARLDRLVAGARELTGASEAVIEKHGAERGGGSTLSAALTVRGRDAGSLTVSSVHPDAFDGTDATVVRLLAAAAAAVMAEAEMAEELDSLTSTDPLTGFMNRRGFERAATSRLDLTRRKLVGSVLVLVDLDHYDSFIERHGQEETDQFLQICAERWATALRAHDILCRWAAGEFLLLLSDCADADARMVCERMRTLTPAGQTFSAGVAIDDMESPLADLMARATVALKTARLHGGNRTVIE